MLKIEKTDIHGWEAAIRGARNSFNSWDKSDSYFDLMCDGDRTEDFIGCSDVDLMKKLAKAGPSHAKYRRFITVTMDVTGPLYWWKEMDTYKVGTVGNSCSTMHKIADKEFELEDFSHEHLDDEYECVKSPCADPYEGDFQTSIGLLLDTIEALNWWRKQYLHQKEISSGQERLNWCWWQMIQLLPSSYNQKRTLLVNYEVLANIYHQRKGHKLDEWRTFCEWIEGLPMSEIITGISYEPDSNTIEKVAERFEKLGEGYTVSPEELKDLTKGDSND